MKNSQPHSNPGLQAALDATLARVCKDRDFMRRIRPDLSPEWHAKQRKVQP